MTNQVVNDLQSQIDIIQTHYDKYNIEGLTKENMKGLSASQMKSLNELARINKIKLNLNENNRRKMLSDNRNKLTVDDHPLNDRRAIQRREGSKSTLRSPRELKHDLEQLIQQS